MQSSELILSILRKKASTNATFIFRRMYRYLFNIDFYRHIYYTINKKEMPVDIYHQLLQAIDQIKTERYYPTAMREYRGNKGKRMYQLHKLDFIVWEGIKQILAAIYEPLFSPFSYGWRCNSQRVALQRAQAVGGQAVWAVQGKIRGQIADVNLYTSILLQTLQQRIYDGRYIEIVHRFLQAGYAKLEETEDSFFVSPVFCVYQPLLCNIVLHACDRVFSHFGVGVHYMRYNQHFLFFIDGNKKKAQMILEKVNCSFKEWFTEDFSAFHVNLSDLQKRRIFFLNYELKQSKSRYSTKPLELLVSGKVLRQKLKPFMKNGQPVHVNVRMYLPIREMIMQYNAEIKQLCDYYSLAIDLHQKINRFRYVHYTSLLKTIARKEKSSIRKVIQKYGVICQSVQGRGIRKVVGVIEQQESDRLQRVLTYFNPLDPVTYFPLGTTHVKLT